MSPLPPNVFAWIIAIFIIVIVLQIPFPPKFTIKREAITPEFRRQRKIFLTGFPIGALLGILSYLPFFADIFKWPQEWYYLYIQADPVILYVTILILVIGLRIITALVPSKTSERKSFVDGIFYAFIAIQVALFLLGYNEIFFPTLNPQFHHGILFLNNSTNN